jgi:MYXO-CTERM domain-containing protein
MFIFGGGKRRNQIGGLASAIALTLTGAASAGVVNIGGGWQASWDPSLDPYVSINPVGVSGNAVFIQKSAEFIQGPVNGIFPSIPIVFRAIGTNPVSNIVIDDEIITNSTGAVWTDFHMDLLDHGEVVFDPAATAASGGGGPIGFSIAPFTQAAFNGSLNRLDIWGGVVNNGDQWFPGDGATDGQLWMHVNNAAFGSLFVLKETPTPTPGALALIGVASLLGSRRRRG